MSNVTPLHAARARPWDKDDQGEYIDFLRRAEADLCAEAQRILSRAESIAPADRAQEIRAIGLAVMALAKVALHAFLAEAELKFATMPEAEP